LTAFAVLHEGKWYENGEMGWWGCSNGETMTDDEWYQQIDKIIKSVPEDTLINVVDCHI
jgi:hypothetical protein